MLRIHSTLSCLRRRFASEQGNEEQIKEWTPRTESWEIIGFYGQTELGHGSNVRGIETYAKWNPDTKDFTIHSPTLTAAKWWNGSLGRTANHAIIVALIAYLSARNSDCMHDIYRKDEDIVKAFKNRVSYLAYKAYERRIVQKQSWTDLMVELHRLAIVHSESILVDDFYNAVFTGSTDLSVESSTLTVLRNLFRLFALTIIDSRTSEFILSGTISMQQLHSLSPPFSS